MELLLAAGIIVISGVSAFLYLQKEDSFDIESDFKELKNAMKKHRNKNIGLTKGIENLKPFLASDSKVDLSHYVLSMDDQFLVVKKLPKGINGQELAKKIGGKSIYSNNRLKLSFYSPTGKEPIAVIKFKPMSNLTTTTRIEYSHEASIVDKDEVLKVEWKNNQEYFETEGVHTVKLRVMDKQLRWSEWVSQDIFVSRLKGIKSISAKGSHLFVCHNDGTVDGYGDNNFGQLGNCTNQDNVALEQIVQLERIEAIACGDLHSLFLKTDRKVFASGKNEFGQLGIGNRNDSKIPKLSWGIENIIQVAAGNGFSAAVTHDGFVYTWGQNEAFCLGHDKNHLTDRPSRVEGVSNVKSVSLGTNYILALCYDGTVMAWGENNFGQLGLGYKGKFNEPTVTILKDIKQVCAGKNYSYAITNNDRVLAFGQNEHHQLGIVGEKTILFPKEIPNLKEMAKIVSCNEITIGLDKMGNVYTWGQFSPINQDFSTTPYKSEKLKYIQDIAASLNHGYAVDEEGFVYSFTEQDRDFRKIEFRERIENELPKGNGEDTPEITDQA